MSGNNSRRRTGRYRYFHGKHEDQGGKKAANYLVGKVLLTRKVNREGLKVAMQNAWRTVKEVKIESMGKTYFCLSSVQKWKRKER